MSEFLLGIFILTIISFVVLAIIILIVCLIGYRPLKIRHKHEVKYYDPKF